jgi:hypothetical protein
VKRSETIISRRLRQISTVSLSLILILTIRIGYMKLLYGNGSISEKKQDAQAVNTDIIENIESSFNLNLHGFRQTDADELIDESKSDPSTLTLIELLTKTCANGCDGEPAAFLKIDHGYILYKEADGKNVALQIKKASDRWDIVNATMKQ